MASSDLKLRCNDVSATLAQLIVVHSGNPLETGERSVNDYRNARAEFSEALCLMIQEAHKGHQVATKIKRSGIWCCDTHDLDVVFDGDLSAFCWQCPEGKAQHIKLRDY